MGPLMVPALVCDWCGTCAVLPADLARDAVGLDGWPRADLAAPIMRRLGWRVDPDHARCPADVRDHADQPAPEARTLTAIEGR